MIVTYSGNSNALGYLLNTNERIVSRVTSRPAPPKIVQRLKLARQDGAKTVANYEDEKVIEVEGYLSSATTSGYRGLVDEFKKELSYENGKLTIEEDDGVKRDYTANVEGTIELPYEHYNITYSPFKVNFLCSDPYGYDQSYTTFSGTTISGSSYSVPSITFSGSKNPLPLVNYFITTSGGLTGFEFKNEDNNQSIRVDRPTGQYGFVNGDTLSIDCDALTTKLNGSEVTYSGVFPQFELGANANLKSYFYGSEIDEQKQESWVGGTTIRGENWEAQSFKPSINGSIIYVDLLMSKIGTPPNLVVDIRNDNSNKPGSTIHATQTISTASISSTSTWTKISFSTPYSASANTKYWIVCRCEGNGGDVNNYYNWLRGSNTSYTNGDRSYSLNAGSIWSLEATEDLAFRAFIQSSAPNQALNKEIKWKNRWR